MKSQGIFKSITTTAKAVASALSFAPRGPSKWFKRSSYQVAENHSSTSLPSSLVH
jgi:hypothetical protein